MIQIMINIEKSNQEIKDRYIYDNNRVFLNKYLYLDDRFPP